MIEPLQQSSIIHIFKGKSHVPIKLTVGEILLAEILDIFPTGTIQLRINDRVVNAQPHRELTFSKGDKVYVKVEKPLSDGTIPLRVMSYVEANEPKAIWNVSLRDNIPKLIEFLNTIFTKGSELKDSEFLNLFRALINLSLQSLPEEEKMSVFDQVLKTIKNQSITKEISELIELLTKKNIFTEEAELLKNTLLYSEELNPEGLKRVLNNTGVTFEAKIKNILEKGIEFGNIKEDLKFIINSIVKEAKQKGYEEIQHKAEHILRQLEGFQVISKGFDVFFSFLPILWKEFTKGSIALKSFKKEGKNFYSVFVMLNLEPEPLYFTVTLLEKNFFISFSADEKTLQLIKNNEKILKEAFSLNRLKLSSINYVSKTKEIFKHLNIENLVSLTA